MSNDQQEDRYRLDPEKLPKQLDIDLDQEEDENRIVFAHYKNILGQAVYKFYGEYKVDWTKTNTDKHVFKRVNKVIHLADYQV